MISPGSRNGKAASRAACSRNQISQGVDSTGGGPPGQTATIDYSLRLGSSVLQRLGSVAELHKPRVEQASFAVLKAHDVPSILVETAFISNPQEEKRLNDRAYQDKLARAILDGIRDYVARQPPRPASPMALK